MTTQSPDNVPSDVALPTIRIDGKDRPQQWFTAKEVRALLAKYAAPAQGQHVSIDISTGDHYAGRRAFDVLTGESNGDADNAWLAEGYVNAPATVGRIPPPPCPRPPSLGPRVIRDGVVIDPTPPAGEAQEPIGWVRNERGDATGLATLDPLFLLGASKPAGYEATYAAVYRHPAPQAAQPVVREYRMAAQAAQDEWEAFEIKLFDAIDAGIKIAFEEADDEIMPGDVYESIAETIRADKLFEHAALSTPPMRTFQGLVQPWMMKCFGLEISADRTERNHRFFEESTELVQALGMTASEAHQLVDYTFNRPAGEPIQEAGGVMVTLAALCLANGMDMHRAGWTELARISDPHTIAKIRAKQAAKPKHSPLPEAPTQPMEGDAPEPLHITHRPLIRQAISLLRLRAPVPFDFEQVASELEMALEGKPTPAGEPSEVWLNVAAIAAMGKGGEHG